MGQRQGRPGAELDNVGDALIQRHMFWQSSRERFILRVSTASARPITATAMAATAVMAMTFVLVTEGC